MKVVAPAAVMGVGIIVDIAGEPLAEATADMVRMARLDMVRLDMARTVRPLIPLRVIHAEDMLNNRWDARPVAEAVAPRALKVATRPTTVVADHRPIGTVGSNKPTANSNALSLRQQFLPPRR